MSAYKCYKCKKELDDSTAYDYRGLIACDDHHDEVIKVRDLQRQEIIDEESAKTDVFRGLDLGGSVIGQANRKLLAPQIEIAGKESGRLKAYEKRK